MAGENVKRARSKVLLWAGSFASICVLCLSAASQLLADSDPGLAVGLNPFNTDARVNAVVAALSAETTDLVELEQSVHALLWSAPGDARGYSLLGAIRERQGDAAGATELYRTALWHAKTELHALLRLADHRLKRADLPGALDFIDTILRRWPDNWGQIVPILRAAATIPEGRAALRDQLDRLPPWRRQAISQLVKEPAGLLFARDLLLEAPEAVRQMDGWPGEVNLVVSALASAKAYGEAQMLFLSTLTAPQAALAGYVYDPEFTRDAAGGYFGWRVARGSAADVQLPAGEAGGLRLRFQDAPARPGLVSQVLRLPAGGYRFETVVSGAGLALPRRLVWRISCPDTRRQLGELEVPEQSYSAQVVSARIEVPAVSCPVQRLTLDTEVTTDSWRDRYEGEVLFSTVRLHRL